MKRITLILWLLLSTAIWTFAYDFKSGDLYYNITSNSTVEVTYQEEWSSGNYSGLTSAVIPESVTYNGTTYSVTSIGESAFRDCSSLTSITIPNSVTSIEGYAFYGCSGLTSVTIPNSVTSIGYSAFSDCRGLTSVTIPNSVTSIGNSTFEGCTGLTSIVVESGNTIYDSRNNCNAIIETAFNTLIAGCQNTTIPNSVTSIGEFAFFGCSSLTSVTIPNSVTSIGYFAFHGCSGLTSITIPNSVTSIGYATFSGCSSLTSITIPNSVTTIGESAFDDCTGLTSVTIPNSVTSIGDEAFYDCSSLTSVTIPNSVTSIGSSAFNGCTGLTSVTIGNSVTSIGESAFYDCIGLTSVTIGNSVTSIGEYAFRWCRGLTSVTIGNSVTSIGDYAFYGCSSLTSVTIPNSVTSIGYSAFSDCSSLTSVTIPDGVTSIGDYAFYGCSGLTSIMVESGNKVYDSRNNCNAIIETETNTLIAGCQNTIIPNSVTSIGDGAFSYCTGLTSVTIPNSVETIGGYAFLSCIGLTSVTIGNSVTSIGENAFKDTPWLENMQDGVIYIGSVLYKYKGYMPQGTAIVVKEGTISIGGYAFYGCTGLISVTIPNNVETIGGSAFEDCSGLTSITIPNSVTSIGESAFSHCSSLKSVAWDAKKCEDFTNYKTPFDSYYDTESVSTQINSFTFGDSVQHIPAYICKGMSNLTSISIGSSVTSIGESAFSDCSSLTSVTWNAKNYADCTSGATPFYYSNRSDEDFDLRSQITSFVFGDSVQHIPAYICNGMDKLVSITIGKDVMSIGNYALAGCTSLTYVKWNAPDYTATNPFYCESVGDTIGFDLRKQITSFVCGDSVYAITPDICYQMTNLDTLACPTMALESKDTNMENYPKALKYVKLFNGELTETIKSILSGSRKTIRTLDLGDVSNTAIPDEAFREFYKMDTLVLPAQLTKIPYKAASECVALQSIVVPEGVTEIEYGAFSGCSGLQTLTLPSTLLSIADNGFASCSALKEMRVHAQTPPTVFANTFSGVKRAIPVYVPQSAYNDYTAAEVWKEFFIQSDVADSVENTPANDTRNQDVRKVFRNGQIYILRGDKTYTLTGEEL